jgi:hypothetical protein
VDKTEDLWHAMHIIADALDELGRPEEAAGIRPRHRPPE